MNWYKLPYRAWYYFRIGYGTYLSFVIGYVTTVVTVYYLAIKESPFLLILFPKFLPFAILGTLIGAPLSVLCGWLHLKQTKLYSSETDIGVESNPYNYKLVPGYQKDVLAPLWLETLRIVRQIGADKIPPIRARKLDLIEQQLDKLIQGEYVGTPRRRANF